MRSIWDLTKPAVAMIAAICLAGLLLAACSSSSSSSETVSNAEFSRQASKICTKGEIERTKVIRAALKVVPAGAKATNAQLEQLAIAVVPNFSAVAAELEELTPPEGDEAKIAAIVAAIKKGVKAVEANPQSGISGNAFKEADELVTKYGLTKCVS